MTGGPRADGASRNGLVTPAAWALFARCLAAAYSLSPIVGRNGIAKGASGCAMTKLGCAFTSCGASTSSISAGRRGCCAEAVPKEINMKPQPKMAGNQCRVVILLVAIFCLRLGLVGCCYGSGAPGRKFFEDIAATPDAP